MPKLLYTVQNLVDEIRSQIDEVNTDSVDTIKDILPTLNRAQDYAFDTLSRLYPEPIIQYATLPLISGQSDYDMPEYVFEDRVEKLEIAVPSGSTTAPGPRGTFREIQRVSYRDISNYESASLTNVPYYYCIFSRKIRFVPTPTGTYNARMWYLKSPEQLVLPQGRITIVNKTQNYLIVDAAGSSLTTESDDLNSYVNVVDGQSGELKGTLQIQSISGEKITFRTTPQRTTVVNRTVSSMADLTIEQDDYLAEINGTCVPYYGRPTSNFLVQFTVAEIVRKLGGQSDTEEKILEKFEKQVERTWVGRETQLRVKKRSQNWGVPTRRWYYE